MPSDTFTVDIVTPDRVLVSVKDAVSLVVPAAEGYLGVQAGHAPLMAQLVPGEITLTREAGAVDEIATSGGFLDVTTEHVTLLADTAERAEDIDMERAEASMKRAEERLQHLPPGTDIDRARLALQRAAARLKVALL